VVDHVDAALDERDAVVAWIDVEEIGRERTGPIVAELELEHLLIEVHHVGDALEMHHHVAHAERAGAEARNIAAGLERIAGGLGAVEDFEPVAGRVVEHDQVLDVTLVGERARAACHLGAGGFDARRDRVERRGLRDLPAEEADALATVDIDHQPLLPVVHAERQRRAALVEALHAEEVGAVGRPIAQILGADADIAQSLDAHDGPRLRNLAAVNARRNP
jgi:hypothetical protein